MDISPYALLCASKPKQPQTVTTEYDLYSLSLPTAADTLLPQHTVSSPMPDQSAPPPAKRTHYIADIHTRHTNAIRQTPQDSRPL